MCGITGVFSKSIDFSHHKVMQHFIILDTLRGIDGTGMAFINANNQYTITKSEKTGSEFLKDIGYFRAPATVSGPNLKAIIGHNRAATQGSCTAENSHPFGFSNLVGVHNGTLDLSSIRDFKGFVEIEVDSEILYSELNESDISTVWSKTGGALALCWFDKRDNKLHFARNKERSLFFAFSKDNKDLYWASEEWMISTAVRRSGKEVEKATAFEENKHYAFSYDDKGVISFTKEELIPYQKKHYPVVQNWPNYRGDSERGHNIWKDTKAVSRSVEYDEEESFIVTEIIDTEKSFKAFGLTKNNEIVNIFFPSQKRDEIKKKIVGRGFFKGVYTPKSLKRYHTKMADGAEFYSLWEDLIWERVPVDKDIKILKDWGWLVVDKPITKTNPDDQVMYTSWLNNQVISKSEWEEVVTKNCCAWCASTPEWRNRDQVVWMNRDTFLCEECSVDSFIRLQTGVAA